MKYSIVIPAHNEGKNIGELVRGVKGVLDQGKEFEIIVVNDDSTDDTKEILEKISKEIKELRPITRIGERGVGNAIREGLKNVRGEIIITLDGDLSHDPSEIPTFVSAIEETDMVFGSRYMKGGRGSMPLARKLISRTFNIIFSLLLGLPTSDFTSGFRAYKREVIESLDLESREFGIYVEIPVKAFLRGYRMREVPIHYHPRVEGKSKLGYMKQGPEYLNVVIKALLAKFQGKSKPNPKQLRRIYYSHPSDIDSKALQSNIRIQRKWHEEKIEGLNKELNLAGKRVLDIGCGSGGITFLLADKAERLVGLDFNEKAIKYAQKNKNSENVQFLTAAIEYLPFADESFDIVTCLDVLDHSIYPESVLQEIRRILVPSGELFLTVENWRSFWPIVQWLWDKFGGRHYQHTHVAQFNKNNLRRRVKGAGFGVTKLYTIHNIRTFFYLFTDYYPRKLDEIMKKNCLGLTLLCRATKQKQNL